MELAEWRRASIPSSPIPKLPARTGVVVVGGGIIGTSTAFFLARKGIPVVLCEKGHIAGEQSSRNWGWCRKMGRDPREMPLAIEALRLWPEMNALTEAETGFRQCGIVYLCRDASGAGQARGMAGARAPLSARQPAAVARRGGAGAARARPATGRAALYTPSDGRGEPQKAAPAIAEAARRHGAAILTQCAVRGIETAGGRVAAW